MRLLLLTPEFDGWGGGIMTFYRDLLPALVEEGVSVHVIEGSALHAAPGRNRRSLAGGITVETLERPRLEAWWSTFSAYEALPLVRRHLAAAWAMWEQGAQGDGFDIVEACDWGLLFVPTVIEANIPCIVQCHGSVGQIAMHDPVEGEEGAASMIQLLERAVMAKAPGVQTYASANAVFWSRETGRNVEMVRPGWRSPALPQVKEANAHGAVFGRVQRWKGPQILAAALAKFETNRPAIDWYGRDTAFERTGRLTSSWLRAQYPGIWGSTIRHHAPVPPEEVAALQAKALFNAVPSTWDVFNFTGAEAMASGRPAIISDGAGVSELVQHGETGFVFRSGDADSLAAVLEDLLGMPAKRLSEIGAAGREAITAALDPRASAARRKAAYAKVISDFLPGREDGWLAGIAKPSTGAKRPLAFLDALPLRGIAGYVLRRAAGKFSRKQQK